MSEAINLIKVMSLKTQGLADRKPSLPIIQFMRGRELTVPIHMAKRAVELGLAEIVGASSDDENKAFNENVFMQLGFPAPFIEKLESIGITSKEELVLHSRLSLLDAFGDDEERVGRDAADFAHVTMQEKGLSLRPASIDDLCLGLFGEDHLDPKVAAKFTKVAQVVLSEIITNTEDDLKALNGIGDGSVKQLVHSLGAASLELKPVVDVDEDDIGPDLD